MNLRSMCKEWDGNRMARKAAMMAIGLLALGFLVSSLRLPATLAAEAVQTVGQNSRIDSIRQELTKLKAELALKQGKYSSQHPDILRLKREIERVEHDLETAKAPKPAEAIPPVVQRHTLYLKDAGHAVEVKPGPHTLADTLATTAHGTIIVLPGTHTLTTSRTLAPAVTLRVLKGAIIHVQDGVTLTCNGTLEAGPYQIFSWNRTGKVALGAGAMTEVFPKWWGAKGDGTTDDYTALFAMVTSIGSVPMNVNFTNGTYVINSDLDFASTTHINLPKGAILKPGEVACTGSISTSTTKISGRVNCHKGSERLDGTNFSNYYPGQWIVSPSGVWRQVRYRDNSNYLWMWRAYGRDKSGKFAIVKNTLAGSGTAFLSQLKPYDFVYWDANDASKHMVVVPNKSRSPADTDTSVTTTEYPNQAISAARFTRSVRIIIRGSFTAGKYQVFSGRGVVQFLANNITEIIPEWWGATTGYPGTWPVAQANSDAIEKAVYANVRSNMSYDHQGGVGSVVKFGPGIYRIGRHIPLPGCVTLDGCGKGGEVLGGTEISGLVYTNLTITTWPDISLVQSTIIDYYHSGSGGQEIKNIALRAGGCYGDNAFYTRNMFYAYLNGSNVSGGCLRIHDCAITGSIMNYVNMIMVQNNYLTGFPAFYGGVDSFLQNNQIEGHFGNRCAHGTFDSTDGWTYTNWTIDTRLGKATHTGGNLSPLYRTLTEETGGGWQINVPGYVAVKYTITNNSANGRLRVKVCGSYGPYRRGPTSGSKTYVDLIHIEDPTDRTIQFVPQDAGAFNGAISKVSCLANGLVYALGNNEITGNIMFSDGGSAFNLFTQNSGSTVTDNQMGPGSMIAVVMNMRVPKVFSGNAINSFEGEGILLWGQPTYGQITENHIRGGGQNFPPPLCAIAFSQGSEEAADGSGGEGDVGTGGGYVCRYNHIQPSNTPGGGVSTDGFSAGPFFPLTNNLSDVSFAHYDYPLIEHNYGYDEGPTDKNGAPTTYPEIPNGKIGINATSPSTPSVVYGSKFSVTRGSPTDITDLLGGCRGKEVKLFFKDANSTIRFDTLTTLVCLNTGAGTKWTSTAGAIMVVAFGDDGKGYCIVYGGRWS
jgi:hypothetical protein